MSAPRWGFANLSYNDVIQFLETFPNIVFHEIGIISIEEKELANKMVRDIKDRPIFLYLHRMVKQKQNFYLISGDKDLLEKSLRLSEENRILTTREFFNLV